MHLPTLADLDAAAATVYAAMQPTAQLNWPLIDAAVGAEVWVKHENHTPVGAFKVRGGLVYLDRLRWREPGIRGVISATRGNHGQSLAWAGGRLGLTVDIVVPRGNSEEKNAAMRALGARLIEHGADFNESLDHARLLAERERLHLVPSFHPDLVAGVASYWLELLRAQPDLDLLIVPVGQGSGISAAIAARHALGLSMPIIGVVSAQAPAYQLSFQARRALDAPVSTWLADGLACRIPNPDSLALILEHVEDVVAVSDGEVAEAMRTWYRCSHNLAEGAGAAALAAALKLKDSARVRGRRIGLPLSGANVDASLFAHVLREDQS